jgi:hypothetical protein
MKSSWSAACVATLAVALCWPVTVTYAAVPSSESPAAALPVVDLAEILFEQLRARRAGQSEADYLARAKERARRVDVREQELAAEEARTAALTETEALEASYYETYRPEKSDFTLAQEKKARRRAAEDDVMMEEMQDRYEEGMREARRRFGRTRMDWKNEL